MRLRSSKEEIQQFVEALNKILSIEGLKDLLLLDSDEIKDLMVREFKENCLKMGRPLSGKMFEQAIGGVKIEAENEVIPWVNMLKELEKNVCPLFKKGEIIKALNHYNDRANIFKLSADKGLLAANNNVNEILFRLLGSLLSALTVLKEDDQRIRRCKWCSQYMLKRGEIKRFCSEACRNNAHNADSKFDPGRKEYHKMYSKIIKVNEQSLEEFQEAYKQFIESQKEKISHGKKTKSK